MKVASAVSAEISPPRGLQNKQNRATAWSIPTTAKTLTNQGVGVPRATQVKPQFTSLCPFGVSAKIRTGGFHKVHIGCRN